MNFSTEKSLYCDLYRSSPWQWFMYQVIWKEEISIYFSQTEDSKCEEEEWQSSNVLMKTFGAMNSKLNQLHDRAWLLMFIRGLSGFQPFSINSGLCSFTYKHNEVIHWQAKRRPRNQESSVLGFHIPVIVWWCLPKPTVSPEGSMWTRKQHTISSLCFRGDNEWLTEEFKISSVNSQ